MELTVKTFDSELVIDEVTRLELDQILHDHGYFLNKRCGGEGTCGGCKVVLEEGEVTVAGKPISTSSSHPRNVLACCTKLVGNRSVVRIPSRSLIEIGGAIEHEFYLPPNIAVNPPIRKICVAVPAASLTDHRSDQERMVDEIRRTSGLESVSVPLSMTKRLCRLLGTGAQMINVTLTAFGDHWKVFDLEGGDSLGCSYGMAIDIGTTTVVGLLINLETGAILQNSARYNQQVEMADDVASRISAAKSAQNVERLQRLVVLDTINPIIDSVCHAEGITRDNIKSFVIAGNTVMAHLLLGLDVSNIGKLPFNPCVRYAEMVTARQLHMHGHPDAHVEVIPAISGYIGGDITADICVAELESQPDGTLLVDIGTNAEMVLKDRNGLICCATPAGPAFEGAGLLHGCRASKGAIAHVKIGPDLEFTIECIEDAPPKGVCGSAIIDFIAEGFKRGLINRAGRFVIARLKECDRHVKLDIAGQSVHACALTRRTKTREDSQILVTEADIAQILQAKAAIFSGIKTLLEQEGRSIGNVSSILLAGGFARHINLENAMCIGMLPRLPTERFVVMGNSALAGAYLSLVDYGRAKVMHEIHLRPRIVELNLVDSFEGNFIDALYLPEAIDEAPNDQTQSYMEADENVH
ncbi:MAG TPA: ASKHA domain-containing protein [Noviherbaspirillum sp.]|uniref:ASKHA domain-containing protein n=1 Tax=Noviherbaspirillum sp. TaxID=1926288 RepID=UPI002B4756A8|nr:ASKHA domain-containing protein [Noviherbaspirillum sp.]HJV88212.1 ASKHA domain-containing protein [Noviherbaspirillum sp.]